jgi:hypothetical protein
MVRIEIRGVDAQSAAFETSLREQCRRLALKVRIDHVAYDAPVPARAVSVVFAGGARRWTARQASALDALVAAGIPVLPVVEDAPAAGGLPDPLKKINAFLKSSYGADWAGGLVDEVLGLAWTRRRTRKVFISYKRTDSAPMAGQLFDKLNRLGYETFLDDASIDKGAEFQRELKWWLNDADMLLVLLSPAFDKSEWCLEEIAFAQARYIGVLCVDWPAGIYADPPTVPFPGIAPGARPPGVLECATADQHLALTVADFDGAPATPLPACELTEAALARVIAACARQRAVAIRQRLDNLIPLARTVLPARGPVDVGPMVGDLRFRDAQDRKCFARVLPFRPRPETIHQAYVDAAGYDRVGCFYAENDRDDARTKALLWLADNQFAPADPPLAANCVWAYDAGRLL